MTAMLTGVKRALSRPTFIGWLIGMATAGLIGLGLALLIIFGGIYNTAASSPHFKLIAWAAHTTMLNSVSHRSSGPGPGPITDAGFWSGAREYEEHCIACHGGPGIARAPWVRAMLPTPPFLIDARTRWSRAELRVVVRDGVKMSAMPAWGEVLPARKIDDLVDFLEVSPNLTVAQFDRVRQRVRAQADSAVGAPGSPGTPSPSTSTR